MKDPDRYSILLVEDERIIALAERAVLERYDYGVMTASSGEEALRIVDEGPRIDLVLMDIDLGAGIDGPEAASRLLKKHDLPIVFLSAHTEREVVERTEGISSYGYIVKNSGETVLIASLKMAFRLLEARKKERRQEEALRQSEERYRSLIAVSETGGWEYNRDTGHVWGSPEYFRMLGLEAGSFPLDGGPKIREVWLDLIHPADRERAIEVFRSYIANGSSGMYENSFRIRHADGHWLWLLSRGRTLRAPDGSLTNLTVGTHIDLTRQKLAEERMSSLLEEKERGLDAALLLSPEG